MAFEGLTVISSTEKPKVGPNSTLTRVLVITIRTDLGNEGQLEIPVQQAEKLSDEKLAEMIISKAASLDRAHLL